MKRIVPLLWLCGLPLWAQFNPDWLNSVVFSNQTGQDIYYLFFSPSDSEQWAPDILGSEEVFSDGDLLERYLSYSGSSAFFDCQALDEEGNVYEVFRFRVSDDEEAYLELAGKDRTSKIDLDDFESRLIYFSVDNLTENEIYYLFLSPPDSDEYGIDFMDSGGSLEPGGSREVALLNTGDPLSLDLQAVDEYDQTYSFSVDLDTGLDSQYVEILPEDLDQE